MAICMIPGESNLKPVVQGVKSQGSGAGKCERWNLWNSTPIFSIHINTAEMGFQILSSSHPQENSPLIRELINKDKQTRLIHQSVTISCQHFFSGI